ncbi:MAG TPA: 50S ribosomal protein L18 [Candidatus Portnoybacteria bacterium]|nr:50S ribosomal protein L18 [Candidatus Portnoybacteria bacterium]
MDRIKKKRIARVKRHRRVRKLISGTESMPRLCVFRSNRYVYAQLINDLTGKTIIVASDFDFKKNNQPQEKLTKSAMAQKIGQLLAQRAKEKGIKRVVFDRGGYRYFGRVKSLAEGARKEGLKF